MLKASRQRHGIRRDLEQLPGLAHPPRTGTIAEAQQHPDEKNLRKILAMLTSVYACQSVLWDSFPGSETEFHARQAREDLQGAQQFGIVFFVARL